MDNDLKFTIIWELGHFPKSTESHLDRSIDFIRGLTFWSRTYSESPQNFRSYDILHDHVVSVLKFWEYFKDNCQNGCRTVYNHSFYGKKCHFCYRNTCAYRISNNPGNNFMKFDLKCTILYFKMDKTIRIFFNLYRKFVLINVENWCVCFNRVYIKRNITGL